MFSRIRIELDNDTLRRLRQVAAQERRAPADQAAVEITKAMARRRRRAAAASTSDTTDR